MNCCSWSQSDPRAGCLGLWRELHLWWGARKGLGSWELCRGLRSSQNCHTYGEVEGNRSGWVWPRTPANLSPHCHLSCSLWPTVSRLLSVNHITALMFYVYKKIIFQRTMFAITDQHWDNVIKSPWLSKDTCDHIMTLPRAEVLKKTGHVFNTFLTDRQIHKTLNAWRTRHGYGMSLHT